MPDPFDLIARYYERLAGPPVAGGPERVLAALDLAPGQWLADVGGGTGRVAQGLAAQGVRVVVCDRSRGMLAQARAKGLRTLQGSVNRLPLATGSVDAVLVVDAFHHFTRPSAAAGQAAAAAELMRILRAGGRLLIEEPDIRRPAARFAERVEKLLLLHSRFLAAPDLAAFFVAAGGELLAESAAGFSLTLVFRKGRA